MTSSMLAGERRWASARRGGKTVLGKVAVPKPINLPSQRLENHGLDPNVEIVPKGSLSWGSRPSSSASNPWGSSLQSPSGDCSNGSPSHAGGRPSSGGSATRPSTAGSDKMQEPVPSAWGSNSRPSSASGALASNQTSLTSLRPRSAETRPGSSQLSRFSENIPDSSAAWGRTGNADKLVISSTKKEGFSLTSGDFPTLGSERDNSGKDSDSHEYGAHDRPRSSPGEVAAEYDRTATSESDVKGGNTNTWKRDDTQHAEDGFKSNLNSWQGGYPQQFMNPNVPQHFDAWRGPPMNSPAGLWYRGPPGGPPYGPPVAAGGFPLEPFPYYRPQMPPPSLGNSQPVPQQVPANGPRGHHPKNGDMYRPPIPDAYMHPGMPVRPGFYPRPVPYDNYFGAPMGYNPNERDIPFMGMSAAPPVFNRFPAQCTPDHSNMHARGGGREQVESVHFNESRGPYKVLIKQHNDLDAQGEKESWENIAPGNVSFPEKGSQQRAVLRNNEWGVDSRREDMHSKRTAHGEYSSSRIYDGRGVHSSNSSVVMSPERVDPVDRNWKIKSETASASSSLPEIPHVLAAAPKDSNLLQKIEGLNAKARASDGRQEIASASSRGDIILSSSQSSVESSSSRRAINGSEGRSEHRGKEMIRADADVWRKKPLVAECLAPLPTTNVGPVPIEDNRDHHSYAEASVMTGTNHSGKDDGDTLTQILDTGDTQTQRSKFKELARQRAIQLQKEEEERIREQKVKALAKLEELNRRSQTGGIITEKLEKAPAISSIVVDQKESQILAEPVKNTLNSDAPNPVISLGSNAVAPVIVSSALKVSVQSTKLPMDPSEIAELGITAPQNSYLKQESVGAADVDVKAVPGINDISSFKHEHTSYKRIQKIRMGKQYSESLISFGTIGIANIHESMAVEDTAFSKTSPEGIVSSRQPTLPENTNTVVPDVSAAQGKRSSKSGKNKNKLENPQPGSDSHVQEQADSDKAFLESGKMKVSQSQVDAGSIQAVKEDIEQLPQLDPKFSEESHVKVNNPWKSQPPRRISKTGQANKVADRSHGNDATIWAPVRSHHRVEDADVEGRTLAPDSVASTTKNNNLGLKSKRAEMERYVPKQVAKELAQQGTIQNSVSSASQPTINETAGRRESSFQESSQPAVPENVVRTVESNIGDSMQSKHAKGHGGWNHRVSTESSRLHTGSSSYLSKSFQKSTDQQESFIPEPIVADAWDPSDGWNMPEEPAAVVNSNFGMKDQGVIKGKGKRQPYKGHRNMANKYDDQKNNNGGEIYKKPIQSAALENSQQERDAIAVECHVNGERTSSLWQPKSKAYSTNAQTGRKSGGGQHVSEEAGRGTRKNSPHFTVDASGALYKDQPEVIPPLHLDQSPSENKNVGESTNVVYPEGRREKKVASAKERPQPHYRHGLGTVDEAAPPDSGDTRFGQRTSSGYRKHGNQNNRSVRGQELCEDLSSGGKDNRHHIVRGNRERQSRNMHFEYQPVGPHNHGKSNNFEGPTDVSHNMSSRYRERGQGQPRRVGGNSYGRKSSVVQVDVGYE
ncbi:protein MODIFIER OF SNC1 1-like [Daucus carota subsp. sativus]|uniref:protein MODIFIER OF SNC1 1-like n=1 Tax=Daucus carota subsp. sativus TaxID=79200 RepID=UPI0007EF8697|nr:PREDICTED: protein MODIFIER OF SNC1 1-like [Daucus carota subsp. sativus]